MAKIGIWIHDKETFEIVDEEVKNFYFYGQKSLPIENEKEETKGSVLIIWKRDYNIEKVA